VANRISRRLRPVLVGLTALGVAALLIPTATATPADPASPPTVASVQQQLGTLALKNTQLVEQFNQAQVDVDAKQKAADSARLKANKSQALYAKFRTQLSQTVAAQYEGGSFSATGALLSSTDGQSYLDQLNTLSVMSSHTAQMIARASAARKTYSSANHEAKSLLASATAKRDALAKRKDTVQKQVDKYTTLLATLTAAQRAAYQATITPPVNQAAVTSAKTTLPTVHGVSAAAKKAAQFAIDQVGKPYVFGAAGPDSYDCSGLTMAAWATAGVSLPHSAADQYNYGTHVSIDQLTVGDLVFLYQPIGHVEIYIGDGLLVSAPQSGENVSVVSLSDYASDFTGATHLG
jgi:cell wall-associated NlpC family hydrolase